MKNIKLSLVALFLVGVNLVSCKNENAGTAASSEVKSETPKAVAKAEKTTFSIEGMTCAMGCAKVIENKLSGLEGVQKATVDFETKTATVEYDAEVQTPEKLVETVEAVADGKTYKVSNVKNSADKAMNYNDPKKEGKKAKKAAEANAKSGEKKAACCAAKKSCSSKEEKPATL